MIRAGDACFFLFVIRLLDYMNGCSYNIGMKTNLVSKMESLLKIAADQTRIKIMLSLLDEGECNCNCGARDCANCTCLSCMIEKCVGEIVNETGASQSLVSHQLKVLKDAKLVSFKKEGTKVIYYLDDYHVRDLLNVVYDHVTEEK